MPFYLSSNVFKQQAKTLVKHWPFNDVSTSHARAILSQLYGYDNNHHYRKLYKQKDNSLITITEQILHTYYKVWVSKLAKLGPMNEIQAKHLLHKLWPAYLAEQKPLHQKIHQATIHFFGTCNDFISDELANTPIEYNFDDHPSIKDSIEALGVPHTEVGGIRADKEWVGFDCLLQDHMEIEVHPAPITNCTHPLPYKPEPKLGKPFTFLLDVHLAGLARYLRMAGFDCLYEKQDYGDALLAELSASQSHILLTRDIGLLKRGKVRYGHWVRNVLPELQFKEVVKHYQLEQSFKPMTRCVKCNGNIQSVEKKTVKNICST